MKTSVFSAGLMACVACAIISLYPAVVVAQDPIALASAGGITMYAVPNDAPDGLVSNKIVLKADDDAAKIVTFENINIENAHQVWGNLIFTPEQSFFAPTPSALYHPDWIPFDTHILIPVSYTHLTLPTICSV